MDAKRRGPVYVARSCGGSKVRIILAESSSCGLPNQSHTRFNNLLGSLCFRSSQTRVPWNYANFGIGTLVREKNGHGFFHIGAAKTLARTRRRFHGRARLSRRRDLRAPGRRRRALESHSRCRGVESESQIRGSLEPFSAAFDPRRRRVSRRRIDQSRLCALCRADGPGGLGLRSLQLLRPGHRQHGSAAPLRFGGAETQMA